MRIYIRLAPLKRPVEVDVEPSTSVAELCARIGVEALCLTSRSARGGSAHSRGRLPGRSPSAGAVCSSSPAQVLDSRAAVASVVSPHATLIAAARPLPGRSLDTGPSPECQRVADRAPGGEWHLMWKPTPCVTTPRAAEAKPLAADSSARGEPAQASAEHETPVLGEDWEELSLVMEAEDLTPSERGAESLANAVMHKVIEWDAIVSQTDVDISCEGSVMSWQDLGSSAAQVLSGEAEAAGGFAFAWGDNSWGQCFAGDDVKVLPTPQQVAVGCAALSSCCGANSSALLTRRGVLWAGGMSPDGDRESAARPGPAELQGLRVSAAAAGQEHFLVVSREGALHGWSAAEGAEDGGPRRLARLDLALPKAPAWPARGPGAVMRVAAVACGDAHSLVLTDCGVALAFGSNACGQLGLGRRCKEASAPTPIGGKARGAPLRAVAAGAKHSLALTISGAVLAWGSNAQSCLGLGAAKGSQAEVRLPELVPDLPGPGVQIAAGGSHSAVLVQKGQLLLAGSNACGQLARPRSSVPRSHDFAELSPKLCARSVALGRDHSVVLTSDGEIYAFGRNTEGQCGVASTKDCDGGFIESPALVRLPPVQDGDVIASAVVSGADHTLVLCSPRPDAHERPRSPLLPDSAEVDGAPRATGQTPLSPKPPGVASTSFAALGLAHLASLLSDGPPGSAAEAQQALCAALAQPSMLNASFCHSGFQTAHLDSAGLCRLLVLACARVEGLGQKLLDAAAEGLGALADGPVEDLAQRDQLRALAVYLCLPPGRAMLTAAGRPTRTLLGGIAHLAMRMSAAGRRALRDLLADECGDVRVLRDVLLPHARLLADEAIRSVGQQQWLTGPLWEVVAQLQLQRALWEAVLLLQLLASASEEAGRLVQPSLAPEAQEPAAGKALGSSAGAGGGAADRARLPGLSGDAGASAVVGSSTHAEILSFQLASLADGFIPPEVEFWLFQEHAQFRQITPAEVVNGHCWSDAAGMPPRRFCSFMAHANLVPVAFKQRVLQVENVLRQRLSQEQVLWPQADMSLNSGRNSSAFYFMLRVSREDLLQNTFQQMYSASPVDLRRPLRVEFAGEEAIDAGGVMREFFRLLSLELFAPGAGLFVETDESRRRWFSPVLSPGRQLEDYWMVGIIVALAVYNNHPGLDVPLPTALFKMLKDEPTTHKDLAQLFPSHARSLEAIMAWVPSRKVDSEEAMEAADAEFAETFCLTYCLSAPSAPGVPAGRPVEVPLCEGGADLPVRLRDREAFVSRVHEYLLCTSVQPQFESFARGFRRVCNSPLFSVLSSEELQAIVGGEKDLDFARLRQGAQYEGFSANEPYIQTLWTVLEGFSMPRRRRFLAFCTGSDVSPAGGLQDLRLLVQRHGEEPTMRLPVAHTCFNLLLLPRYSSPEKLRTMLITAVDWTEGFGLQ